MKDRFSSHSASYARFRPEYPVQLIETILQHVQGRDIAWDCGTGNGQAAKMLAPHFREVMATDISESQMNAATKLPNILYSVQAAESTDFPGDHFDLVTVAQAYHWFDMDAFNREVQRTLKDQGILAIWTYGLIRLPASAQALIEHLYYVVLNGHWDPERKWVDDAYRSIPFPFEEIGVPEMQLCYEWDLQMLSGYLDTWSGLRKYRSATGLDPLPETMSAISETLENTFQVQFPLTLRIGRMRK